MSKYDELLSGTVSEVNAHIEKNPDERDAILRAEREGQNRKGIVGDLADQPLGRKPYPWEIGSGGYAASDEPYVEQEPAPEVEVDEAGPVFDTPGEEPEYDPERVQAVTEGVVVDADADQQDDSSNF